MNSQVSLFYPSTVTSRMDERIAEVEKARALRGLTQKSSVVSALRRFVSNLLVRVGQRMSPPAPKSEQGSEHVLIRLAR
jgi:hypothetical protein